MILERLERRLAAWEPRFPAGAFRVLLWALASLALIVPLGLVTVPFLEFFNDMAAQPKGKTQGTYGRVFGADRPVDRLPAPGAVPVDYAPDRFSGKDDKIAAEAGAALANPVPRTMEAMRRGRGRYEIFCIACHGALGEADGAVVGPDLYPAPASLHDRTVVAYPDGRLYHVVANGKGKMPGYADKLAPADRWAVVHYVRALQRALDPKPEDLKR